MRNIVACGCALAMTAVMSGGCSRSGNDDHADVEQPRTQEEVSLMGCIGSATGTTDLVLQNVRFDRSSPGSGAGQSAPAASAISENSWVALEGIDRDELASHVGRQVQVTGALVDTTRATGTSGDENSATPSTGPGVTTPSGDKSQAATDQHHANKVAQEAGPAARDFMPSGPAPQIRVREIKETGAACSTTPR